MYSALSLIKGAYFNDILNQPKALADTLHRLEASPTLHGLAERLRQGAFQRIVLTGMGSSYHILHPMNLALVEQGWNPIMMETSELIHYGQRFFDPSTLLIVVSQSGRSVEVLRLLELNQKRASILAITNTIGSPLELQSDAAVLTYAGEEFSVSCKTYVAALLALRWLTEILCGRDPEKILSELALAAPAAEAYLAGYEAHVGELAKELHGARHLFLVGRGTSLAAVGTGALIIKESDHFHAEGMSSAAFRHGPMEMLSPEMFVMVFGGDPKTCDLNAGMHQDALKRAAKSAVCSTQTAFAPFRIPQGPESIRPILEILPVEMITLALAALEGREAGRFELATKVTVVE